MQYIDEKATKS